MSSDPLMSAVRSSLLLALASLLLHNAGGRVLAEPTGATASKVSVGEPIAPAMLALAYRDSPGRVELAPEPRAEAVPPESHAQLPPASALSRSAGSSIPPWVSTWSWEVPQSYGQGVYDDPAGLSPLALAQWDLDKYRLASSSLPYGTLKSLPLFYVTPPRETAFARGLKKLAKEKMFQELRRKIRRQWETQFESDLRMTYAQYDRVRSQINNIGKDPRESSDFDVDYTSTELKQGFLGEGPESDIPLVTWGPFTVTDSAATKFDLGSLTRVNTVEEESVNLGEEKRRPLFDGKNYRVETGLRLGVDPFRAARESNVLATLRSVGVAVEVNWLSAVLGRELASAEIEARVDPEGEFRGFINFVIKSR